ncbi:CoA-transferase family III [Fomitiporia mediterranea MF3/22]|uniref:CoA-transferase family III n=1 Tax=Fomitiporia mediterranea (strain MF3/22) TaxID=694068 RepID=UPI0004409B53|nr:CoA-transferase family III [Fomitiporia mediterranea MF3/22]EJD08168.1 CoA-transferase family III [Fomitiporia mediterranea MF3/22]
MISIWQAGQLVAGPFAGQLLAHFGAEVIKVEPPTTGDPVRVWRELDMDGVSIWFRSISRNKKSVTIDMRKDEGKKLVKELAIKSDILLENFRPGTLEKWGLGPSDIHPHNPDLIFTRVSGYGQTGPWAQRPGYASVCEGEAGFRYINGFPDEHGMLAGPSVRPNISFGDSITGLHAAFGAVLALLSRGKRKSNGKIGGQTVDVSIMESILNMTEGIIPEYSRKGVIRGPSGSCITGIVPTNAYPTSVPFSYILIGANGESIYERFMNAIGRPDLIGPDYAGNHKRVPRQAELDGAISEWTRQRTSEEIVKIMNDANVPVGRVLNVKEIMENEHIRERGMIERIHVPFRNTKGEATVDDAGWELDVNRVTPRLECDMPTRWAGPDLGQHNEEVLGGILGLSQSDMSGLRVRGVIG